MADNMEENKVEETESAKGNKTLKVLRIITAGLLAVFIILAGTVAGVVLAMREIGRNSLADRREDPDKYEDYIYDPDVIRLNGETYRYNKDLTNFLFLGVDNDELGNPDREFAGGGFSDVILFGVLDEKNSKLTVLQIDRNTVVPVKAYDGEGAPLGTSDTQIARAYSYGDGKEKSVELSVAAVSELLYGVPVNGYYVLAMPAVATVNDMIGGVTVTLEHDMKLDKKEYKAGTVLKLMGEEAELYLRARTGVGDETNASRIARQQEYMRLFIEQAKRKMLGDFSLVGDIYNAVMERSCTDITASEAVYLATELSKYTIEFCSIAGETVYGADEDSKENSDMFYPDPDELYRTVIDIFYVKEG